MSQKKDKIGISLPVETVRLADESLPMLGFSSRSELADAAINEYVTLHTLNKFPDEMAEIYDVIEARGLKDMEERMAGMLYKVAVEIAQVNIILSNDMDLTKRQLKDLRKEAVGMVNHTCGIVSLKKADANSNFNMEDEDG
jgi:metal-responsive CopG/Arc/MetJ family transcriptional regulator